MSNPVNLTKPVLKTLGKSVEHKSSALGNVAGKAISAAAIIGGGLMVKSTYDGMKPITKDQVDAIKEHAEMQYMEYGFGHYTGDPQMQNLGHRVKKLMIFGPMNLRLKYEEGVIRTNNWVNNVFLPNLIPLSVMVSGAIGLLGWNHVRSGAATSAHFFKNNFHVPASFKTGMAKIGKSATKTTASGLGKLLSLPFKTPAHFFITLGTLLFANFAYSRFKDSYGHTAQENLFRDLTSSKGH